MIKYLEERIEYLEKDLKNIHDKDSLVFIRGQIAGLKEALNLMK